MEKSLKVQLVKCAVAGIGFGVLSQMVIVWSEGWLSFVVIPLFFVLGVAGGSFTHREPETGLVAPSLLGTWVTFSVCVGTCLLMIHAHANEQTAAPTFNRVAPSDLPGATLERAVAYLNKVQLPTHPIRVKEVEKDGGTYRIRLEAGDSETENHTYYIEIPANPDAEPQTIMDTSTMAPPPPSVVQIFLIAVLGGVFCAFLRFLWNAIFHRKTN